MRKILLCILLCVFVLAGCNQPQSEEQTQINKAEENVPYSVSSPNSDESSEDPASADDNDKLQDMLDGKLNDKEVKISGTVFASGNDGGITTIQIYPDSNNNKLVVTAYFQSVIDNDVQIGDTVLLKGICKGKMEVPGDTSVIGMLADSVEKI